MKCPICKEIKNLDVEREVKSIFIRSDTMYLDIQIYCRKCNIKIYGYNFVDNRKVGNVTVEEIQNELR